MLMATLAALALCLGLCALLARMAEEGLGWLPAGAPQGTPGWEPTQRRPAGWAHRLALACKATEPVRQAARAVAQAKARMQAAGRARRAALAQATQVCGLRIAPAPDAPAGAQPHGWPPRPRRVSGEWLQWGGDYLPLTGVLA